MDEQGMASSSQTHNIAHFLPAGKKTQGYFGQGSFSSERSHVLI